MAFLFLTFALSGTMIAQHQDHNHQDHNHQNHKPQINPYSVSEAHADKFGELIVQTYEGRFAPVHTLAVDVMHKISRKDQFDIAGRGKMSLIQVFLDIPLNADFWKTQKIIYVREKSVADIIGIEGKYASFSQFFNERNEYKLRSFAETAFRKADAKRNKFDKELIRINERVEVFMMTYQGSMLDIFPVQNSENNKWVSWDDKLAKQPITGSLRIINDDLKLPILDYNAVSGDELANGQFSLDINVASISRSVFQISNFDGTAFVQPNERFPIRFIAIEQVLPIHPEALHHAVGPGGNIKR